MSFLNKNYSEIQAAGESNHFNAGWFYMTVSDIEDKKTAKGNEYPEFSFEGARGDYKGKLTSTRFLLCNVNLPTEGLANKETSVRIANGHLKSILDAMGVLDANGNCTLKSYASAKGMPLWVEMTGVYGKDKDGNDSMFINPTRFCKKSFEPPYEGSNPEQPVRPARVGGASTTTPPSNVGETAEYSDDDIPF